MTSQNTSLLNTELIIYWCNFLLERTFIAQTGNNPKIKIQLRLKGHNYAAYSRTKKCKTTPPPQ